jgi:hypothetical protein
VSSAACVRPGACRERFLRLRREDGVLLAGTADALPMRLLTARSVMAKMAAGGQARANLRWSVR